MPDWLRERAASFPGRPALVVGHEQFTFGDLDRESDRTAARLTAAGIRAGDRVALLLRNGIPFVLFTHALARVGAIMVPLNTRLAPSEVAWQAQDSRAPVLIYDHALAPQALAADGVAGLRRIALSAFETIQAPAGPYARTQIALAAPQGVVYTSATSGRPKGVMLSFANHWWNAVGSALNMGLLRDDRWLVPLPLFHVGGLAVLWRSVIYGIAAVVHESFDPEAVNRSIERDGVTIVSVVSTMLQRMLDARGDRPYPSSLRCVLLGGGPAPLPLVERCLGLKVPVAPTYGLTETASQVATLLPDEVERRPGSSGKPLFPTEVRIEEDEILVRGPSVMLGYADRPDDTARALRDGWLRTGDLGHLDEDGYLYVTERREDLIVSGGENVYPAEVEAALLAHPAVADAGVVGLPDAAWGQVVAAAVRLRSVVQTGGEAIPAAGTEGEAIVADAIVAFCRERLAGYKIPKRIWFVDELPRSPSGKLIRRTLREQAPPAPTAPTPTRPASSRAGA
jgi:O-succinylbenzoic acid--CoA ligase